MRDDHPRLLFRSRAREKRTRRRVWHGIVVCPLETDTSVITKDEIQTLARIDTDRGAIRDTHQLQQQYPILSWTYTYMYYMDAL